MLIGRIASVQGEYAVIEIAGARSVRCRLPADRGHPGTQASVCVRPNAVSLDTALTDQDENVMQGEVKSVQYFGDCEELVVQAGTVRIRAIGQPGGAHVGASVRFRLDPERCLAYPAAGSGSTGALREAGTS